MRGYTHVVTGGLVGLAALPVVSDAGGPELAMGVVLTGYAALWPDVDHHAATIAQAGGPVTRHLCRAVGWMMGGHRWGAHSVFFIAGAWAAGWLASRWLGELATREAWSLAGLVSGQWRPSTTSWVLAVLLAAAVWLPVHALGHRRAALVAALAAPVAVAAFDIGFGWLPWALPLGAAAHIAGDFFTEHGVGLLYPWRRRFGVPLFTTGSKAETVLATGLSLVLVLLAGRELAAWPVAGRLLEQIT